MGLLWEDLWYELLAEDHGGEPKKPEWLKKLTKNKLSFHGSLRILCSHGLVEPQPTVASRCAESQGYTVHGCVHSWMVHVLNQGIDRKMAYAAIRCVVQHIPLSTHPQSWLIQRRLAAHADRCIELIKDIEVCGGTAHSRYIIGNFYANQGQPGQAESILKEAIRDLERLRGREHPLTLRALNDLGCLYLNDSLGERNREAELIYTRVIEGFETSFGRKDSLTLCAISNLAIVYQNQGRLIEAEELYKEAVEGLEKAWGKKHPVQLTILRGFGDLYAAQERFQEAEIILKQALEGFEEMLGREHPETLKTVHALGGAYADEGRHKEAETHYKRALEGQKKVLGEGHSSTLFTVKCIGRLYWIQGRPQEAEIMWQQALKGYEKALGREHPWALELVFRIALSYDRKGQLWEAKKMFEQVLKGYDKALGPKSASTHPLFLDTLEYLSYICFDHWETEKARIYRQRARNGRLGAK
jgi:tetratricopeptide (TPR) repeat protein